MNWEELIEDRLADAGHLALAMDGEGDEETLVAAPVGEVIRIVREALLSDETVERAARALNEVGWTCWWCEPEEYDTCDDCRNSLEQAARVALTAAIGDDDE